MTEEKKKRMSMLDSLAAAGPPPVPGSMMFSNRALRSARDAVDSHHVWELDPASIIDSRIADRLDPSDVQDLRESIEANGQTVPILVRRHPIEPDRYLLVYGRRRLEAIRHSDRVKKVRALVANLDDDAALRSQISENTARRDLSFIEKALFARELVSTGFGTQSEVAEVLTVTKSSISMALGILETIGPDLATAIGPAHGVGRPRWEALARAIEEKNADRLHLIQVAEQARSRAAPAEVLENVVANPEDASALAFEAVSLALTTPIQRPCPPNLVAGRPATRPLVVSGQRHGTIRRTESGITIKLTSGQFSDWLDLEVDAVIEELHARWCQRAED